MIRSGKKGVNQGNKVQSSPSLKTNLASQVLNDEDEQFDYIEKEIDEELMCSICLNPFVDPVSHSACGNTFCSKCIDSIAKCPMCSEDNFKKNCVPSAKTIRNMLDKLKVKCSMCKNIVLRGELKDHKEKYCPLHDAYKQVEQLKLNLEKEFKENTSKLEQEFKEKTKQVELKHKNLKNSLQKEFKAKEDVLKQQKSEFDSQVKTRAKLENDNKPIHLNVRGTIMTVSLGDFINNEREPDNLFKKMFNGEYPLYETPCTTFKDSVYFINCDPIIFKHILDWLTFGIIASELNADMKKSLLHSCQMFNLTNICTNLTKPEIKVEVNKNQISHFDLLNIFRENINLSRLDLTNLILNYLNLEKSTIVESDFSGMNLKDVNFKGSNLRGSNFSNCLLESINFQECDLRNCNFSNAVFKNVNFTNSNLVDSNFLNAAFNECVTSIYFTNFTNLTGSTFTKCKFTESIFEEIDCRFFELNILNNNSFNNCIIKNSNFRELRDLSKFKGFKFDSCVFNFNQFTNKIIQNVKFENIDFKFSSLKFNHVEIINCQGIILESSIIDFTNISSRVFEETKSKFNPQLLYRGSRDGFKAINFHSKCDNQGATLTIIKSDRDQIFGGFTSKPWQSPAIGCYVSDDSAFIFKLSRLFNFGNGNYQFKKFNIKQDKKDNAIYLYKDYLSIFGYGYDFSIYSDCNLNNSSYSNFGQSYELPNELTFASNEAKSYLAGSYQFKVKEIEVFKIYQ